MTSPDKIQASSRLPELASEYAEISHEDLIDAFYETEGDAAIGRELSVRLLRHAGFSGDPTTEPLIGKNGQIHDSTTRQPLMLSDYVNYAATHHFEAVEDILDFLTMKPGETDYAVNRTAMLSRVNTGRK